MEIRKYANHRCLKRAVHNPSSPNPDVCWCKARWCRKDGAPSKKLVLPKMLIDTLASIYSDVSDGNLSETTADEEDE